MAERSIPGLLAGMSFPMILAMTVNGLYYLVDAAFVGNAVGEAGVAAPAVGFPIDMLVASLALMCAVSTAAILSVRLGQDEGRKASNALRTSLLLTLGLSAVSSVILFLCKGQILKALCADSNILPHAERYYDVVIPGSFLVFLRFLGTNAVRAEGTRNYHPSAW